MHDFLTTLPAPSSDELEQINLFAEQAGEMPLPAEAYERFNPLVED